MVDVTSRPVSAATARMRSFMTDFRGAATVDEVVEMALGVSPKTDPKRLHYRMRALLKRGDDGRLAESLLGRTPAEHDTEGHSIKVRQVSLLYRTAGASTIERSAGLSRIRVLHYSGAPKQ